MATTTMKEPREEENFKVFWVMDETNSNGGSSAGKRRSIKASNSGKGGGFFKRFSSQRHMTQDGNKNTNTQEEQGKTSKQGMVAATQSEPFKVQQQPHRISDATTASTVSSVSQEFPAAWRGDHMRSDPSPRVNSFSSSVGHSYKKTKEPMSLTKTPSRSSLLSPDVVSVFEEIMEQGEALTEQIKGRQNLDDLGVVQSPLLRRGESVAQAEYRQSLPSLDRKTSLPSWLGKNRSDPSPTAHKTSSQMRSSSPAKNRLRDDNYAKNQDHMPPLKHHHSSKKAPPVYNGIQTTPPPTPSPSMSILASKRPSEDYYSTPYASSTNNDPFAGKSPPRKLHRDESFSSKSSFHRRPDADSFDTPLSSLSAGSNPHPYDNGSGEMAFPGLKEAPPPPAPALLPQSSSGIFESSPPVASLRPKVVKTTKKTTHMDPRTGVPMVTTTTTTTTTTTAAADNENNEHEDIASRSTTTTSAADPGIPKTVEISPGTFTTLRGVQETLQVLCDTPSRITTTSCLGCSAFVHVLDDCSMFLCPVCRLIVPMSDHAARGGGRVGAVAAEGVALGIVPEEFYELQAAAIALQP